MIALSSNDKIYLCGQSIDFRKQMNGLILLTQSILKQNPYSQNYFVFINRKKTSLKILHYDGQGYWLHQKRLSSGKFKWPNENLEQVSLSSTELHVLLMNGNYQSAEIQGNWRKTG
jgi:transposase